MKSIACKYVKNHCLLSINFSALIFMLRAKKAVLFPEIGRVKKILSLTLPHSPMYIRIYNFNFKKQTNKQKRSKNTKNAKETKEETRIAPENRFKKLNLWPPG